MFGPSLFRLNLLSKTTHKIVESSSVLSVQKFSMATRSLLLLLVLLLLLLLLPPEAGAQHASTPEPVPEQEVRSRKLLRQCILFLQEGPFASFTCVAQRVQAPLQLCVHMGDLVLARRCVGNI
jgi:hypothetical protein